MNVSSFPGLGSANNYSIVCFSHLRWDFVYQRPQHLLSRFAKIRKVLFVEEPIFGDGPADFVVTEKKEGVHVAVPHLPHGTSGEKIDQVLKGMLTELLVAQGIEDFVAWYYTPMMLELSEHLNPRAVVYDCMDELSAFKNA